MEVLDAAHHLVGPPAYRVRFDSSSGPWCAVDAFLQVLASGSGMWETVCMAEKRTKADKAQREADLLDKRSSHRPPQNQGKKPREDFNQAAVRIVEEAAEKH